MLWTDSFSPALSLPKRYTTLICRPVNFKCVYIFMASYRQCILLFDVRLTEPGHAAVMTDHTCNQWPFGCH